VKNGTTKIAQLNYPYNKGEGRVRNYNADEDRRTDFLNNIGASIADITMEFWGVKATGSDNDTAQIFGIDPLWREDNRTISWDEWWGLQESVFDDSTLFPLGLCKC
jgi:primary-amine oxidase